MPIIIKNKRINKRGKEIRNFIDYINREYDVPHVVSLYVFDFPCVYDDNNCPAFGVIGFEKEIIIELANDLEWYSKIYRESSSKKFYVFSILQILAHEIYHYFQFRDKKSIIENWVYHQSKKILLDYVNNNKNKTSLTQKYIEKIENQDSKDGSEYSFATDPITMMRKKLKMKIY
ncbi:MAG: hypothetical protein ACOCV1_02360 [Bacillota bacterium]